MNLSPALTQNLALRSRRRRRLEGRPRFDTLAMLAPQREDLQSPQGPSLLPCERLCRRLPPGCGDRIASAWLLHSASIHSPADIRTLSEAERTSGEAAGCTGPTRLSDRGL